VTPASAKAPATTRRRTTKTPGTGPVRRGPRTRPTTTDASSTDGAS
jgi:hypothetical protein